MPNMLIWFSNHEDVSRVEDNETIQYFSIAQDLKDEKKPLKTRYRNLILDYSRFVQSRRTTLKSDDINILDRQLISKFNVLINLVDSELREGKFLSTILGIIDSDLRKACDQFSREYRKLLLSRETLGYIPRRNQEKVDDQYKLMIAELRKKVFAPVLNLFSFDPSAMPDQGASDLSKAVLNNNSDATGLKLAQLYDRIVGFLRTENIDAKVDLKSNVINIAMEDKNI